MTLVTEEVSVNKWMSSDVFGEHRQQGQDQLGNAVCCRPMGQDRQRRTWVSCWWLEPVPIGRFEFR